MIRRTIAVALAAGAVLDLLRACAEERRAAATAHAARAELDRAELDRAMVTGRPA